MLNDRHLEALEVLARQLPASVGGTFVRTYGARYPGFFVRMTQAQAALLAEHPAVEWVEENAVIHVSAFLEQDVSSADGGRWHLDRIDQINRPLDERYHYADDVANVDVFVFDSGIRHDHVEFEGRVMEGYDAVEELTESGGPCDQQHPCHFHGTAVASMIGGSTLGVARTANLHPIKVINKDSGSTTDILTDAITWVLDHHDPQHPRVANFSFWTAAPNSVVEERITALINSGFVVVTSANNQNSDQCASQLPAGLGTWDVITVGGTRNDVDDSRIVLLNRFGQDPGECLSVPGCGSNYGGCVDLWAPGYGMSTADASGTSSYYGPITHSAATSYASGIVAGVAARYLAHFPTTGSSASYEVGSYLKAEARILVANADSQNAGLVNLAAPQISVHPQPQTVGPGCPVGLTVVADEGPSSAYQWFKRPVGGAESQVVGATGSQFSTVVSVDTEFRVRVATTWGAVYSEVALVQVEALAILEQPEDSSVWPNQSVTLDVVTSRSSGVSYQWYTGQSGDTTAPIPGATATNYHTPPLLHTTKFWVRVSSACEPPIDSRTVTVAVLCPAIVISQQPQSATVSSGESLTLSVGVITEPGTTTFQWFRNGTAVAGATSSQFITGPLTASAAYFVRIQAINGCITVFSDTATITVVEWTERTGSFRTFYDNYLSADGCGGGGMNADPTYPGECEIITIRDLNGGDLQHGDQVQLRVSSGHWIVAEEGGGDVLNANRTSPGWWETFEIESAYGFGPIYSCDGVHLKSILGYYVVAEYGGLNGGGPGAGDVNCNRLEAHEWETFTILLY